MIGEDEVNALLLQIQVGVCEFVVSADFRAGEFGGEEFVGDSSALDSDGLAFQPVVGHFNFIALAPEELSASL